MEVLIHLANLVLAMAAAAEALRLVRLTGYSHAWLYLTAGFILFSAKRAIEFFFGISVEYAFHDMVSDILILVMTVLNLYGIYRMREVFLEHRATSVALEHELEDLRRFQRATVGRELRMKELAEENALLRQPPRIPHEIPPS